MSTTNKSILEEAAEIRSGSRNVDYGDAAENFKRIAQIASLITGQVVDPKTCVAVHIATKLSREAHRHKRDNLVDLCGYADILQRIHESEDSPNQGKPNSGEAITDDKGSCICSRCGRVDSSSTSLCKDCAVELLASLKKLNSLCKKALRT